MNTTSNKDASISRIHACSFSRRRFLTVAAGAAIGPAACAVPSDLIKVPEQEGGRQFDHPAHAAWLRDARAKWKETRSGFRPKKTALPRLQFHNLDESGQPFPVQKPHWVVINQTPLNSWTEISIRIANSGSAPSYMTVVEIYEYYVAPNAGIYDFPFTDALLQGRVTTSLNPGEAKEILLPYRRTVPMRGLAKMRVYDPILDPAPLIVRQYNRQQTGFSSSQFQ